MSATFASEMSNSFRLEKSDSSTAAQAHQSIDATAATVAATTETNNSAVALVPMKTVVQSMKIGAMSIGIFALGAAVVARWALPGHALLGFCVGLSIMSLIGLPLILASIADATQSRAHH